MLHQYNFLVWASKQFIYVKHYTLHGAVNYGLVQIERPDSNAALPKHFYGSTNSVPYIELKIARPKGQSNVISQHPTIKMYSSWFNVVRKDMFSYDRQKSRYDYQKKGNIKTSVGNTYVAGLNISVLQDKFVRCEFHFQISQESPQLGGSAQRFSGKQRTEQEKQNKLYLTTCSKDWDTTQFSEPLELF